MISERVRNITPSATLGLTTRVNQLKQEGITVIALNVGEPDFGTPENICAAGIKAIENQKTKYTTVSGINELREAICAKLKRDNGLNYEPSQITVGTGAKQTLINCILTLIDPGDEVIIPKPCWVSYIEMVKLAGGVPVFVACKEDEEFALDIEAVKAAITPKTKAVLFNTPNNPTGAVYSEESLRQLAALAEEHDFYLIADEVYEKLIYDGYKHFSVASVSEDAYNRTVIINGISKAYSMTGWRIGFAAGPKDVIKGMNSLQGHATSNASSISQYAAVEAFNGPQESIELMRQEFYKRLQYVLGRLRAMPGVTCAGSHGAFYLVPNVKSFYGKSYNGKVIKDSFDLSDYLLDEARIALVPGAAFEAPDNLRISYSNSMENLTKALDQMEAALAKLK
ncbi:MAG: pyridoxal phosphate-dependent aminotransferase [Clostridia bacterium]|nr:pyridoxal phosphate-dependent aminotransferase [Clostridia bacterium]